MYSLVYSPGQSIQTLQANQLQITPEWFKEDRESKFAQKGKSILKLLDYWTNPGL